MTLTNTATPPPSSGDVPKPGDLKIKERRSWKTWQLLTAVLVAVIAGMWINGDTGGGASSTHTTGSGHGTLPANSIAAGTGTGGSAVTTTTAPGGSSSTTTTVAGGTTTTVAGGSTTTPTTFSTSSSGAAGPARQLLLSPQLQGDWTSTPFTTTAAGWNIGWAFNCTPAPASGSVVPGIRHARRVGAKRNGRYQRDRFVGAVRDCAVEPRIPDAGRASSGVLHLDCQGHRFVGQLIAVATLQAASFGAVEPIQVER